MVIGYGMFKLSLICQAGGIAETQEIEPIAEGMAGLAKGETWAASWNKRIPSAAGETTSA
jgi:hypothetical protein